MHKITRSFKWRFYPGICIGVRSDEEVETFDKDDYNFTLRFNSHIMLLPFFEFGFETVYCIDGLQDYINLKKQYDNEQ